MVPSLVHVFFPLDVVSSRSQPSFHHLQPTSLRPAFGERVACPWLPPPSGHRPSTLPVTPTVFFTCFTSPYVIEAAIMLVKVSVGQRED